MDIFIEYNTIFGFIRNLMVFNEVIRGGTVYAYPR